MGKIKQHKLLYLCQGHHLATFGVPLFGETISAWDNGPVVGHLWFSEDRSLAPPARSQLDEAVLNTIGYVLSRYGALSGRDLINLTHSQDPWKTADADRDPGGSIRIEQEWIRDYFLLDHADDELVLDTVEVRSWLGDAVARRDEPGPRDDPAEIAARIRDVGGRR